MNILKKSKETLCSVAPIMALVLILAFTAVPFTPGLIARFLTGGLMVIAGLTLFLIGIDIGIIPIGERSGAALTSKKNLKLLLSVSFLIGFMITIAEPDVQVLAGQIGNLSANVNKWTLVIMIALGVGFFVTLGLCRTVLSLKLRRVLIISYLFLFALAYFCPDYLQGAAFDAGGATTGPMTVPFIMALGMGVASVRAGKNSRDNDSQFGLTGIASIGPIAAVCLYGIILNYFFAHDESLTATTIESAENLPEGMRIYATLFPEVFSDVFKSLFPLLIMFICFQIFLLKMPPVQLRKMFSGVVYCFIGLVLFLLGAEGGFMPAGQKVGEYLGFLSISKGGIWTFIIIILAFIFGAITVCAEPAVWVLTEQEIGRAHV